MAGDAAAELASLRFDGKRFEGHALDVECTRELIAYRDLLLACAKELFLRKHPQRSRVPRGFEEGFRLQFDRVEDGSAVIPLQRVRLADRDGQAELEFGDEFDEAAALIDATIAAADADEVLPRELPPSVIPLFRDLGKSLRPDESLFTRAHASRREAAYTERARLRLAKWVGPVYEDVVDLRGEVRMANVGPGAFAIQCDGVAGLVNGRFSLEQEARVLQALSEHHSTRLRVLGLGEFSTADRSLNRIVRVDRVELTAAEEAAFDEGAVPIWQQLEEIGRRAAQGTWDQVPADLSVRIDEVVCGTDGQRR